MSIPTVYKWTDASAPQIRYGNAADFLALYTAVLVNGYGAQPAAGWTIPYSDANSFILQQGGTRAVKAGMKLGPFHASGFVTQCEAAESWANLTTPVIQFAGGAATDWFCAGGATSASYHIPWQIMATDRSMYCMFGYNASATDIAVFDTSPTATQNNIWHGFFGDYKCYESSFDYNQCICHTSSGSFSDTDNLRALTYYDPTLRASRKALGVPGNSRGSFVMDWLTTRNARSNNLYDFGNPHQDSAFPTYPNALDGSLYLDKFRIMINQAIMGEMPGLFYTHSGKPFPVTNDVYSFAGTGDYAGENLYVLNSLNSQVYISDGEWGA